MKNVSDKICRENITQILCSITFFPQKSCRFLHVEKFGRNGLATDDKIIQRMCCACWIKKATDKHSERVTLRAFTQK